MDGLASCKICVHKEPRRLDLIVTDGHKGRLSAVAELVGIWEQPTKQD